MGETHERPALHVEACVVDPGSLGHQTYLQPFQRRARKLAPSVEKIVVTFLYVEYILAATVKLQLLINECEQVAGGNAVQIAEDERPA